MTHWPLPLGVSTSVFARGDADEAVAALAASSVRVIEVVVRQGQLPPGVQTWAELGQRFRDAGVTVRSVHLPYGRTVDISQLDDGARQQAVAQTEANLRVVTALGAALAVLHPSYEPIADTERPARLGVCRQSLERLAGAAATAGVRLAVECLPRTCLAHTAAELLGLIADLDPATVGVCIDANHLNLREPNIAAAVRALGGRLLTLHCSDNDGLDERHWLPGSAGGVVDWPAFLGALRAVEYAGPFLYEVRPPAEAPAEALRIIEANYADLCRSAEPDAGA